ncbi:hypothetical protein A4G30_16175 [Mycobacterium kansasii]|uniref:Uncharacterized protein n=1 Tax=Mycobacterium kansasii TaxID=1768 RepID=A0A653F7R1_MYCKA|nr:hypothetical protein [Mycobacterium kansasii]ARG75779.1 hypothetical protein B1T51_16400 [Mycobacterium kansasii]ARG81318.1 hypothetical protein B1T52_16860 [Mycobacterium kansasii]ARG93407.1 hypothetical protein B1T50_17270 [Mycobacterium kansasii]KZS76313.1 hypothetical protein A4G30_16175 [Mycobacterium kansasii]VTP05086.1 hypothetical protein BIN_B_04928 [Mycobacterium kansasii]
MKLNAWKTQVIADPEGSPLGVEREDLGEYTDGWTGADPEVEDITDEVGSEFNDVPDVHDLALDFWRSRGAVDDPDGSGGGESSGA